MLKTKVKVGSVTNLSEARYCAGMGVDFLSFPIARVDAKTYREITGWVAGPKFGVEVGPDDAVADQYAADFIQTAADAMDRMPRSIKQIVSLSPDEWASKKEKLVNAKSDILFLEFITPTIDATEKSIIAEASKEFEILIKPSSLIDLGQLLQLPIAGLSLEGSAEMRAGLKEYPLADILEKLEVE